MGLEEVQDQTAFSPDEWLSMILRPQINMKYDIEHQHNQPEH